MDISTEFRQLLDACDGNLERALINCHLEGGGVEALLKVVASQMKGAMQSED